MSKQDDIQTISLRELVSPWDFKERKYLPSLTFSQKVNFAMVMGSVPFRVVFWVIRYMLPGINRRVGLKRFIVNRVIEYVMNAVSLPELRILMPVVPLRVMLESKAMRSCGAQLPNYNYYFSVHDASARWICEVPDRKPEDPVILYLHGGAYFLKTMPEQITWVSRLIKSLPAHRLSVLEVDYTVSPQGQYPVQLNEAIRVYEELAKSCSKIILLGDSAGGNLACALTARRQKEKLAIPAPWAVVLVSPWTELEHTGGSMDENNDFDYLNLDEVDRISMYYAGKKEYLKDPLVNMWVGGHEYWQNVFPERTLSVWGDKELLRDACRRFADMAGLKHTFEEAGGVHDAMIVGFRTPSSQLIRNTLDQWLSEPERPAPGAPQVPKL